MQVPELLALALATGLASGLNAYASVAILGLTQYAGWLALPAPMDAMGHPWVISAALILYLIEFIADKIPYVDSVWDAVHTFIRVPIGALLAGGMVSQFPGHWQLIIAMAGGFLAFQAHGTKASIRLAANASPEPFSNWALSIVEDLLVAALLWFAANHPYLTLVLVAALAVGSFFLMRMIFRTFAKLWRKIMSIGQRPGPAPA